MVGVVIRFRSRGSFDFFSLLIMYLVVHVGSILDEGIESFTAWDLLCEFALINRPHLRSWYFGCHIIFL